MKYKMCIVSILAILVTLVYYNMDGEEIEPSVLTVSAMEDSAHRTVASTPEDLSVFYYVTGAVVNPGLYMAEKEQPVGALVSMAGGLLPYADGAAVNGATMAPAGTHIHVPLAFDGDPTELLRAKRLNINQADEKELQSLPGVGPAIAKRITEYRKEHGYFTEPRDIMKVRGIGKATFEKIEKEIRVS